MKNILLVFLLLFAAIRGYCQCTLSVSLTSSGPSICSGSSVVLTAAASAGTAPYSYAWSDGETTSTISVNKPGTYSVTVSDKTPGCQPVKQSITITTATASVAPTAADVIACPNSSVTLTATAPGGTYQWYDAPVNGNFLATGASYTTPPITANTIFYVQTTLNGCTSPRTAVTVTLQSNPGRSNATVCYGDPATLVANGNGTFAWYDNANATGAPVGTGPTFVTPPLTATTIYYVVLTSSSGCVSTPVAATAFVTPPPAAPTASGAAVCSGNATTLHAAGAGTIDWFASPTGGTSLISSPDFTTPPLTTTTTYYVQSTVNTCVSSRTPVTVTVNQIPQAPTVANTSTCSGTSATLTPTGPGGGTYQWYSAQTGGALLFTGPSFTTPVLTHTTTYYVLLNTGCISARAPVTVTVTPAPASPSAAGEVICSGSSASLTATAPGGTYEWWDSSTGGNLLFTGATFNTPALTANTTYYVQTTVAGCISARTAVPVTIMPPPSSPVVPGTSICPGGVATLNVTNPSGTYAWYDSSTGGNLLAAGPIFMTPVLSATTTYYVEFINSTGCPSVRTAVTVTVNTPPSPPTVSGTTVCPGSHATLTATGAGTITWYDAATGGNLLFTGATYTTPALSATTTYYVEQTTSCPSTRTAVTVNVTAVASPQFLYSSATYCPSGPNPTPVINNPAGGTFSASPAGLIFVSTTTGQINLGASTPGQYTVSFAGNGICPISTSVNITITNTPDAHFSFAAAYCQDQVSAVPTFPAGASAGTFTVTPAGINFFSPLNGEFNPSRCPAGTYTITNTIPANGSCPASAFSTTVVIGQSVTVSAGPNQTVQTGSPVTLAGSVTGGATTGTWSGGTGSFSNPNALNAVYTPGAGETSATLTLTSSDPAGPCGPKSAQVTITFSPLPTAPVAAGTTVCPGSVATLTATAPGGTYKWYDAATGGTLLNTGPTFVTPPINANTTYYVQTTIASSTSPRTAVTVALNATPAPPAAQSTFTCSGTSATLTATGSAGGYEWFDAATGGNLLSTNATYTTTFLTTTTSYYVESVVNGCASSRVKVDVTITPVPNVTSSSAGNICSGSAQNYAITADVSGATFTWSRAAVANISNPAVAGQTSSTITETLVNTSLSPINVTYVITPVANGCTGTPFDYVVTVNPSPVVSSPAAIPVCSGTAIGYNITFNSPAGVTFTWSRAAVAGISNAAISGQASGTINESLFNTTNAPVPVTYVITYQTASCTNLAFTLTVTVNPLAVITSPATGSACTGVPENYTITSNVAGATFVWSRPSMPGISNPPVNNQTTNTITETLVNATLSPISVPYSITPTTGACAGTPFTYTVTVNPNVPTPVAYTNTPVCTGNAINLQSPTVANATYFWSGPNSFTSNQQNPTISNVTSANAGTYSLYIMINGCSSTIVNADVFVNPPPVANAGSNQTVCNNTTSVSITGSVTGGTTTGIWTTSGTGTFNQPPDQLVNQYLPSAADLASGSVTLTLTSTSKDNCTAATSTMTITFSAPSITSASSASVCSGTALNYTITSDFATATFSWSRAAVTGISNGAISGQTTSTITETLINTTTSPIQVPYIITPVSAGCPGKSFTYTVTVNPIPAAPTITSNSPVCVGSTLTLQTPTVAGATYAWTGPNGYTSNAQNPTISNVTAANAGGYSVTLTVAGCTGPASASFNVLVDPQSTANAGPDQTVCPATTTITLNGTITGGPATGKWTTTGTGTIASATSLQTTYAASAQDITAGSVTFTLSTVSNDNCSISTSQMTVKFQLLKAVTAGPDQSVCSQSGVKLDGQITIPGGGVWTSSGTGTFVPSAAQLDATYYPSQDDITAGFVSLTLTANNAGNCYIPSDNLTVTLVPPPTVTFDGPVYVLKGQTVTLMPKVSDPTVSYVWSPDIDISSTTVADPVVTGSVDRTYTVTVVDSRGCVSTAKVNVIVSPLITIPNTFTPNGDGVNDQWNIQGLSAYTHASVDIFDRNGQKVFHSIGYGIPWDGTANGKQVPYGVYYYIIDPKFEGLHVLSGYVTVVR